VASVIADPAELLDLAKVLEARADAVAQLGNGLARGLDAAKWAGPGADQFRMKAGDFGHVLALDLDQVRGAVAAIRNLADQLTQELDTLKSIEADVIAWFATNHPGVSPIPPPWPQGDLPPSGDPRWRQVQAAFASAGIKVGHSGTTPVADVSVAAGAGQTESVLGIPVTPAEKWILDHENASYDTSAYNPINTSTGHAFGLGQLTDATREKYLGANMNTTDPALQIQAFRGYIKDRYGTAEAAVEFWKAHNWY
jgi:hypothetical protein